MNRLVFPLLALALITATSHGDQQDEKPWLDLQHCAMCKCMGENMDMMQHITWENHKISNGALSASVIPEKYRARMKKLHEQMHAVAGELEKGKKLSLCGYCDSYEALKKAGVKTEEIQTDFGMIALTTSNDPKLVKKIHAHTDKTNAEFKMYMEAQQGER